MIRRSTATGDSHLKSRASFFLALGCVTFTFNSPSTKNSIKQKNVFPILVSDLHFCLPFTYTVCCLLGEGNPQSVGKQPPS